MDKALALKILRLDFDATKADAKKAYRDLAKLYHPDVAGKHNAPLSGSCTSMEDINLAFHFILPHLPRVKRAPIADRAPESRHQPVKKGTFGRAFRSWIRRFTAGSHHTATSKKRAASACFTHPRAGGQKKGTVKRGTPKKFEGLLKNAYRTKQFAQRKTINRQLESAAASSMQTGRNPYAKYWALRKKMRSAGSAARGFAPIGRIEKISPVPRVSPVSRQG